MNLAPSKILSISWLIENDYKLALPKGNNYTVQRVRVLRRLYEQLEKTSVNNAAHQLANYTDGTNWLTITKAIKADFKPLSILKGKYNTAYKKDRKTVNETRFSLVVMRRDTGKEVGSITTTVDEVDIIGLVEPEKKPELDVKAVLDKRTKMLEKQPSVPVLIMEGDKAEDLAVKVCTDFATGLITINECCERYGITYLYWAELCQRYEYIRGMYEKAIALAHFLNNSRQLTMVENIISDMLAVRTTKTIVIRYEKKFIPGRLDPIQVEKGRTETIRDLSLGELAGLQALLLRMRAQVPGQLRDEFADMTDAEIMELINKGAETPVNTDPEKI